MIDDCALVNLRLFVEGGRVVAEVGLAVWDAVGLPVPTEVGLPVLAAAGEGEGRVVRLADDDSVGREVGAVVGW